MDKTKDEEIGDDESREVQEGGDQGRFLTGDKRRTKTYLSGRTIRICKGTEIYDVLRPLRIYFERSGL